MNLISVIPTIASRLKSPRQVISNSWAESGAILKSDVNFFGWKRPVDAGITNYLKTLLTFDLKPISFFTDINDLEGKLEKFRTTWDAQYNDSNNAFWEDVYQLGYDFLSSFSKERSGTLHLSAISNNACTKFHTDGYALRLFTTYYGVGTEWLPEKAVNRSELGKTNELIVKDPSLLQQMETFEVGILKGELPNRISKTKGIVHRSPEIEPTGEKRIILRIDI